MSVELAMQRHATRSGPLGSSEPLGRCASGRPPAPMVADCWAAGPVVPSPLAQNLGGVEGPRTDGLLPAGLPVGRHTIWFAGLRGGIEIFPPAAQPQAKRGGPAGIGGVQQRTGPHGPQGPGWGGAGNDIARQIGRNGAGGDRPEIRYKTAPPSVLLAGQREEEGSARGLTSPAVRTGGGGPGWDGRVAFPALQPRDPLARPRRLKKVLRVVYFMKHAPSGQIAGPHPALKPARGGPKEYRPGRKPGMALLRWPWDAAKK